MEVNDLVVLAPVSGISKLMNLEWGDAPEPYGLRHMVTRGGRRFATFNYTYPGGPEVHAYLVVPRDSLDDEDFKPSGKYWGARNAGPVTAIPKTTLVRSRRSRLVIPGATTKEEAAILDELLAPKKRAEDKRAEDDLLTDDEVAADLPADEPAADKAQRRRGRRRGAK